MDEVSSRHRQVEWNQSILAILSKSQPGSWHKFFTQCNREVFKEIARELLMKWGYETDLEW
jgi:hypothetical protein